MVVGIFQGVQGVGLAAGAHGGTTAGGAVLRRAARRFWAGHGRCNGGQAVGAQRLHLGY